MSGAIKGRPSRQEPAAICSVDRAAAREVSMRVNLRPGCYAVDVRVIVEAAGPAEAVTLVQGVLLGEGSTDGPDQSR